MDSTTLSRSNSDSNLTCSFEWVGHPRSTSRSESAPAGISVVKVPTLNIPKTSGHSEQNQLANMVAELADAVKTSVTVPISAPIDAANTIEQAKNYLSQTPDNELELPKFLHHAHEKHLHNASSFLIEAFTAKDLEAWKLFFLHKFIEPEVVAEQIKKHYNRLDNVDYEHHIRNEPSYQRSILAAEKLPELRHLQHLFKEYLSEPEDLNASVTPESLNAMIQELLSGFRGTGLNHLGEVPQKLIAEVKEQM